MEETTEPNPCQVSVDDTIYKNIRTKRPAKLRADMLITSSGM